MMNEAKKTVTKFAVVFNGGVYKTGERVVGTYSSRNRASNAANKKDLEYGSYAHFVREIEVEA